MRVTVKFPSMRCSSCLYRDGKARGIAFVVKSGGGFERAVAIESEEEDCALHLRIVSNRIPIRIGGIELAHDGSSWFSVMESSVVKLDQRRLIKGNIPFKDWVHPILHMPDFFSIPTGGLKNGGVCNLQSIFCTC